MIFIVYFIWCWEPFTPATGVQIPLGTPIKINGRQAVWRPFFCADVKDRYHFFNFYCKKSGLILTPPYSSCLKKLTSSWQNKQKKVIMQFLDRLSTEDILPYVLNGPIYLFLLSILLMNLEVNILYENNMLQDFLQICQFIRDIIMCV